MKAIIFDFDGVVVDSQAYWDRETIEVYREMVPNWTQTDDLQLKGRNLHDIYPMLVEAYGLTITKEEFFAAINVLTRKIYGEWTKPMDGVLDLLTDCRSSGLPIGLASSSERQWIDGAMQRLGIDAFFDPIVTAADVGVGKPDPAVYVEAARRMGHAPADCIAIEDSRNGVASAKAAGMVCIGLLHADGAFPDDLSAADILVPSLRELSAERLHELSAAAR